MRSAPSASGSSASSTCGSATTRCRRSARAESLLAYLLLHREAAQPRQRLAFLLWPDSSEPQARTNLRRLAAARPRR